MSCIQKPLMGLSAIPPIEAGLQNSFFWLIISSVLTLCSYLWWSWLHPFLLRWLETLNLCKMLSLSVFACLLVTGIHSVLQCLSWSQKFLVWIALKLSSGCVPLFSFIEIDVRIGNAHQCSFWNRNCLHYGCLAGKMQEVFFAAHVLK